MEKVQVGGDTVLAGSQGGVDTSTPCWQLAKAPLIHQWGLKRAKRETAEFGLYFVKKLISKISFQK